MLNFNSFFFLQWCPKHARDVWVCVLYLFIVTILYFSFFTQDQMSDAPAINSQQGIMGDVSAVDHSPELSSDMSAFTNSEGMESMFAGVPQSTPCKSSTTGGSFVPSSVISHPMTFLLTSPETTAPCKKPSTSGTYLALPPT